MSSAAQPRSAAPSEAPATRASWLFAVTIAIGAFLLFLVQPLIARIILPWFGGSAAVWTTCMMFFQCTLLLGYLYSFWSVRFLRPRTQAAVHALLLAGSLAALPILPSVRWKPSGSEQPVLQIGILLAVTVGIPYLALSTTGPLLQAWYSRLNDARLPYRFYALSNLGSLLALLSYPILIEPLLRASTQAYGWSAIYGGFVLLCGAVAAVMLLHARRESESIAPVPAAIAEAPRPRWTEQLLWIALAACPAALLLAITTHVSQNIAPIPLLWVVPLSLYLISLVLCFDSDRWYIRQVWYPLFLVSLGAMAFYLFPERANQKLALLIPLFLAGLFVCCMACHGELSRRKPAPAWLTSFYLMLAAGGAIGGIFVAVMAPLLFRSYLELPLILISSAILVTLVIYRQGGLAFSSRLARIQLGAALGVVLALTWLLTISNYRWMASHRLVTRNFYGQLRVQDRVYADQMIRDVLHGTINHGSQILTPEKSRHTPVSYYGFRSGVGRAIADRALHGPIRIGAIGLGAGTLAAYARRGDSIRFYEINPAVEPVARTQFTYLKDCLGSAHIVLGDGRRSLESEPPQDFDIIAVDAFSGDAIPVHLLTIEAFREYFRHLKPDGIVAVHTSNRYLKLEWVVRLAAAALGKQALYVEDDPDEDDMALSRTDWILVSGVPHAFEGAKWKGLGIPSVQPAHVTLWTDDYSNLLTILK